MQAEVCPHCGAKMQSYWHRMTPGLVKALVKFAKAVKANGVNHAHTRKDAHLTTSELCNFTKLRHHGLVAKYMENGEHVTGEWLLTKRAGEFLRGEIDIPLKVKTYRNKNVDYSKEMVNIRDIGGDWFENIKTIKKEPVPQQQAISWMGEK